MTRDITTIATGFSYLECPLWHEGRIWFVAFYTHRALSAQPDGSDQRVEVEVPQQPSDSGGPRRTPPVSCAITESCDANPTAAS